MNLRSPRLETRPFEEAILYDCHAQGGGARVLRDRRYWGASQVAIEPFENGVLVQRFCAAGEEYSSEEEARIRWLRFLHEKEAAAWSN